jgi:putative phage-type endonuclease
MEQHNLPQGSPEWLAYRAQHFNASDAPAMMGLSDYKTRTQLLQELHTGLTPEVDASTQRRFDAGHRFEALARPLAEKIIGEDLYPVTGSEGKLSASFDGLTMCESIAFEHKTLNDNLRAIMVEGCNGADLDMQYQIQMEQQLMVSGAGKCLFMASKWQGDELVEERHCWYVSNATLRQDILQGWTQFAIDLENYVPAEVVTPIVAKPASNMPVVFQMQVEGKLVACNIAEYKPSALAYIAAINTELLNDQHFADAFEDAKFCRASAIKLNLAIEQVLGQMGDINSALMAVREISAAFDAKGLALEKDVKARKDQIRVEIVSEGAKALASHIEALNTRLGKAYLPHTPADFAGAVKGKRTIDSLRDAVNTTLAGAKIAASATADKIAANLRHLSDASAPMALFADLATICLKAPDDFQLLVKSRMDAHKVDEEKKADQLRESIRKEEAERLEREQRERRADITAIRGWYGNYCATLDTVESGLQKVAAWIASPIIWGEMIDEAKAAVEEQRVGLEKRREFLLNQQPTEPEPAPVAQPSPAAPAITHEVVTKIMMPPAVRQAMASVDSQTATATELVSQISVKTEDNGERLTLTQVNAFLAPIQLTAAGLAELGFPYVATDKSAKLYRECDLVPMCCSIQQHAGKVAARSREPVSA